MYQARKASSGARGVERVQATRPSASNDSDASMEAHSDAKLAFYFERGKRVHAENKGKKKDLNKEIKKIKTL